MTPPRPSSQARLFPSSTRTLQLGGYSIDHQALSTFLLSLPSLISRPLPPVAASDVGDEPLSSSFTGVLGLALPINSVIAQRLPPTHPSPQTSLASLQYPPHQARVSSHLLLSAPVPTEFHPSSESVVTLPTLSPTPVKYTTPLSQVALTASYFGRALSKPSQCTTMASGNQSVCPRP